MGIIRFSKQRRTGIPLKNQLIANLRISFIGELFAKVLLFLFELLLANYLSYVNYALWSTYQIALKATPYYHFGILSFYNKYYPILTGEDKNEDAENTQKVTYISMLLIASSLLILCLLTSLYLLLWKEQQEQSLYVVLIGLIIFFAQGYIFYQAQYRSQLNFSKSITGLLIYAFTMLVSGYFLIDRLELYGALISLLLANLMAFIYYKEKKEIKLDQLSTIRTSFKLGLAPFSVTISHYFLHTSDRIFFSTISDELILAGYSFCFIFIQMSYMFASSIGTVLTPYTLRNVGKKDYQSVFLYCCNFSMVAASFSLIVIVFVNFLKTWFLKTYFPQYIFVLEALPNYILISLFMTVSLTYFSALFGAHKEKYITLLNISFMLVNIGALSLYFIYFDTYSLIFFSYISLSVYMVYFLCCLALFIYVNSEVVYKLKLKYLIKIFSILIIAILAVLIDRI